MTPREMLVPLPWQQTLWRLLQTAQRQGRLGHAWLLQGQGGAGREHYARALAAGLLCREHDDAGFACGVCQDCRHLLGGSHPGFLRITPEEDRQRISVEQIRVVAERLGFTSHDGRDKIVVIKPAEGLSLAAANALLKTLEEPPPGSLLLLITEQPSLLPATIRSRCRSLRFAAPDPLVVDAWLQGVCPEAGADSRQAAMERFPGAPLLAQATLSAGDPTGNDDYPRWFEQTRTSAFDPLALAGDIPRERLGDFLNWAQRRLAAEALQHAVDNRERHAVQAHLARWNALIDTRRRLDGNANPLLATERLLIGWRRIAQRQNAGSQSGEG